MAIIPPNSHAGSGASFELNAEQNKVASGLNFEELKEYLRACAAEANVIDYDARTGEVSAPSRPTPPTTAETVKFAINGKEVVRVAEWRTSDGEAGRQLAINAAQSAALREAMGGQTQHQDEPDTFQGVIFDTVSSRYRDGKTGAFLSDADAKRLIQQSTVDGRELARQSELELRFKRGEITSEQYLRESGAVERVLEAREIQSWTEATEAAIAEGGPLEDWPGSSDGVLLERLGKKIEELGLENCQNRISALAEAWSALKEEIQAAEESKVMTEYEKELAACTSRQQIDEVQQRYFHNRTNLGRSIWNQ
jgi:hypothetical protein